MKPSLSAEEANEIAAGRMCIALIRAIKAVQKSATVAERMQREKEYKELSRAIFAVAMACNFDCGGPRIRR